VYNNFCPTWESVKAPSHMLQLLTQVYNSAELYYLPVYVPNEEEKADPALFAQNVRNVGKNNCFIFSILPKTFNTNSQFVTF
jgi:hypothetical protein